jgi:hypothetical protein
VHLVTGGADRGGGRFKLGASMPSAVNEHVSGRVVFLSDPVRVSIKP